MGITKIRVVEKVGPKEAALYVGVLAIKQTALRETAKAAEEG